MQTINPYTEEAFEIEETRDLDQVFQKAEQIFKIWKEIDVVSRVRILKETFRKLKTETENIASLITEEVGKPIKQSQVEVERSLEEFSYMLNNAEKFLEIEKVEQAEIHFAPLGVVAVISPWNFPVMLPLRGIVPALLAGNSVIFKPSELSPRCGIKLFEIFESTIKNNPLLLVVGGKDLGAKLVDLPVSAIAFTGSTQVGKQIANQAAQSLKRVLLELGGLDAAIVLEDADIERAAEEIIRNNARNSGQVCNAIKRVLVHESLYADFVTSAVNISKQLVYGDPRDFQTDVGPLISKTQYARVQSYLDDAILKGAKLNQVTINKKGYLFPQSILTEVPNNAKLLKEEPFGPILPVLRFKTIQEAIEIANDTSFGLTASVWTKDNNKAREIAEKLDVGMVRQNTHAAMQSGIPWGGCKESGLGRMKTKEGLREFCNVKVIA